MCSASAKNTADVDGHAPAAASVPAWLTLPPGDDHGRSFAASLGFFLKPVAHLLEDPEVSEIMVNGPDRVYVEIGGELLHRPEASFGTHAKLNAAAANIAQFIGQTLDHHNPLVDGRLPDGSRVCLVRAPLASCGTTINIRKFKRSANEPGFLLRNDTITEAALEYLELAVRSKRNVLVSGGTGSGKTTVLNILTSYFDPDERVVVIEDTRELQVAQPHVVQMTARPADAHGKGQITIRDLFVTSLRMRPDRILVGEIRRGEALDLVQAMTSGHAGSLATLHASTPADALRRLEAMALMSGVDLPLFALRGQIAAAIDVVVQTNRTHTGARRITAVSEMSFDETAGPAGQYVVTDLFALHQDVGAGSDATPTLRPTGRPSMLLHALHEHGQAHRIQRTAALFGSES
ncbi:MAG: ATPase, T2SS/T4P/T4SS family [Planctomycetota bacterium]